MTKMYALISIVKNIKMFLKQLNFITKIVFLMFWEHYINGQPP